MFVDFEARCEEDGEVEPAVSTFGLASLLNCVSVGPKVGQLGLGRWCTLTCTDFSRIPIVLVPGVGLCISFKLKVTVFVLFISAQTAFR